MTLLFVFEAYIWINASPLRDLNLPNMIAIEFDITKSLEAGSNAAVGFTILRYMTSH